VELASLKAKPLLTGAQRAKVFACLWNYIVPQLHDNAARCSAANVDVEETAGGHFGGRTTQRDGAKK